MEFQIGNVWVRCQLRGLNRGQINIVYPISDHMAGYVKIFINNHPDEAVVIETLEYERGDKDAEKSAIS